MPFAAEIPATPPTRSLTEAEAEGALRRDWLFQSMGQPLLDRVLQEIGWALDLAGRLAKIRNHHQVLWRSRLRGGT